MIKSAFASLSALFVVMFSVFFTYGTIGVTLFKQKTAGFEREQSYMADRYGNANFESLENAMITLVQGFVGEAFHEIMLATKNADIWDDAHPLGADQPKGDNWAICFYIISYFLMMTLLFGNLFFGLLLSIFGCLYDVHKSGEKLTNHTIKKASQLRLMGVDDGDDPAEGQRDHGMGNTTKIEDALRMLQGEESKGRKESVTLDVIEPIPEEMAFQLSSDCIVDQSVKSMGTLVEDEEKVADGGDERTELTPTATNDE